MSNQNRSAIVLAGYGTAEERGLQTYQRIRDYYCQAFPGCRIELAFTSSALRRKPNYREAKVPDLFTSLALLHSQGYEQVVVQSLQLVPGGEFHHIASLVNGLRVVKGRFGFRFLGLGQPLLVSSADLDGVSQALADLVRSRLAGGKVAGPDPGQGSSSECERSGRTAAVLMGHGSRHPADSIYARLALQLARSQAADIFLGTLDGYPGLPEVLDWVKACGATRVHLFPFLLVAGAHAIVDMAGQGENSWRSRFLQAGLQVEVHMTGLGEMDPFLEIFVNHTREAWQDYPISEMSQEREKKA